MARPRVPICYASRSRRAVLGGQAKAQLTETIAAAIKKKELPAMEPGAMCYMTPKQGYAGDSTPYWPPHLMFFYSETDPAIWGANLPDSPVFAVAAPRNNSLRS
jgi:hypothetical protein